MTTQTLIYLILSLALGLLLLGALWTLRHALF